MTEIQDSDREIHLFRRRLSVLGMFVFACFCLLVARSAGGRVVRTLSRTRRCLAPT